MRLNLEGKTNQALQDDNTNACEFSEDTPDDLSEPTIIFPMSSSTPDRRCLNKLASKVATVRFGTTINSSFNSDAVNETQQELLLNHSKSGNVPSPPCMASEPLETCSPKPETSLLNCRDANRWKSSSEAKDLQQGEGEFNHPLKADQHSFMNLATSELSAIHVEDEQKGSGRLSGIFQNRSLRLSSMAQMPSKNRSRLLSCSSDGGLFCRICHLGDTDESFIYPCRCSGTMGAMHQSCVEKWLGLAGSDQCEICGFAFVTERKQKPFTEWLFNPANPRERKNLMTDGLCFLVLTPLATVSTWLCVVGARHYYYRNSSGHHWETVGLSLLTMFLILIYVIWCAVALRFHRRTFLNWQKKNQAVRVLDSKHCKKSYALKKSRTPSVSDQNNNIACSNHGGNGSRLSSVAVDIPSKSTAVCTMTISCGHFAGNNKPSIVGLDCKTCALRRSQQVSEEERLCSGGASCSGSSSSSNSKFSPRAAELDLNDSLCPHRHFKVMLEIGSSLKLENVSV